MHKKIQNKNFHILLRLKGPFSLQARALCPQHAESDVIRFLVGSQSLKFENQVILNFGSYRIQNRAVHVSGAYRRVFLLLVIWHLIFCDQNHNTFLGGGGLQLIVIQMYKQRIGAVPWQRRTVLWQ